MKKLIVYYSYEGRTAYLVNALAKEIEAETLPLQPIKEIKTKGFMKYVWGGYQAIMRKKPDIETYDLNMNDYDEIIFASPVWAGTFSPSLRTFFYNEDILAKKVAFFYTHEGGIGKIKEHFEEVLFDNYILGSTDILTRKTSKEDNLEQLKKWATILEL